MKYFLILFVFFGFTSSLNAADEKSKEIEMPKTFVLGDPIKGSELVESCAACHGVDGNSMVTDWPKLSDKIKNICMSNYCILEMDQG